MTLELPHHYFKVIENKYFTFRYINDKISIVDGSSITNVTFTLNLETFINNTRRCGQGKLLNILLVKLEKVFDSWGDLHYDFQNMTIVYTVAVVLSNQHYTQQKTLLDIMIKKEADIEQHKQLVTEVVMSAFVKYLMSIHDGCFEFSNKQKEFIGMLRILYPVYEDVNTLCASLDHKGFRDVFN
jgi:hypothetical protein